MAALASAEGEWQRALMDYRFEDLEGGRDALERVRLERRRVRAGHDEYFRQTAEALAPNLFFQPFADHLECYLVKEPQNSTVVCLWLRSPESLDLRMPLVANTAAHSSKCVGRTEISLASPFTAITAIKAAITRTTLAIATTDLSRAAEANPMKLRL